MCVSICVNVCLKPSVSNLKVYEKNIQSSFKASEFDSYVNNTPWQLLSIAIGMQVQVYLNVEGQKSQKLLVNLMLHISKHGIIFFKMV